MGLPETGWRGGKEMQALRTPDDRFVNLPDFPFAPHYAEIDDLEGGTLRVHHLDEGPPDGPVMLLLHGEPSWSFLYRSMIPILVDAGFRCIAPDLVGFGRSDKPTRLADFSYERHVAWLTSHVFEALDLTGITMVCQDWGGLLGLRLLAAAPERFSFVVAANTMLPDGTTELSEGFFNWKALAASLDPLPSGMVIDLGTTSTLSAEIVAAYDAPFPDASFTAGPKVFPELVVTSPDMPSAAENRAAWATLSEVTVPFLTAFSDADPVLGEEYARLRAEIPGAEGQPHTTIAGGGHFLQEDCGPELARVVIDFARRA